MTMKKWSELRKAHVSALGEERIADGTAKLLSRVRAQRLAEIRKRLGFRQKDVAEAMGVSVGRISQIESGDVAGIDVLDRYVMALGGQLEIVATFGDEQLRVG